MKTKKTIKGRWFWVIRRNKYCFIYKRKKLVHFRGYFSLELCYGMFKILTNITLKPGQKVRVRLEIEK